MIEPVSNLPLASKHRVTQIQFHPTQPYLAVQSHDRSVEIFRIRTEEEVKKKLVRRQKRSKEKKQQEQSDRKGKGSKMPEGDGDDNESATMSATMESNLVDFFTPHLVVRASGKIRSFDFGSNQTSSHKASAQVSGWGNISIKKPC